MRAFVFTGGRHYNNVQKVTEELDKIDIIWDHADVKVFVGDATGLDEIVRSYCLMTYSLPYEVFDADWIAYGKTAGPKRNIQMLEAAIRWAGGANNVTLVAYPGGLGTENCKTEARKRGILVRDLSLTLAYGQIQPEIDMNKPNNKMTVKLSDFKDGSWVREKWFGIGPFAVTINQADQSATVELPDHEMQILPVQQNNYGPFYQAKAFGGVAFIDILESQQFGTYARIKFRDGVQLPDTVLKSMAGPAKPQGGQGGYQKSNYPAANNRSFSNPSTPSAQPAKVQPPAAQKPAQPARPVGKKFGSNG